VVNEETPFDREALLAAFKTANIDGRVFFWPLSSLPSFEQRPKHLVSHSLSQRAMNLPSYHDMTDEDIARVMDVVATHIAGARRACA
jgi:perosamine synthetase